MNITRGFLIWTRRLVRVALLTLIAAGLGLSTLATTASAASAPAPIRLLATIQIPGHPLTTFDISWVDAPTHTYYLSDQSNAGIDIVDTRTNAFVARVAGFAGKSAHGFEAGGPNGVMAIPGTRQVWAGDGGGKVRVIDAAARPPRIVATIDTGAKMRADELSYDPADRIVMVASSGRPPFVSLISASSHRILGRIAFPDATYGVEQSVWVPAQRHFFVSIPVKGAVKPGQPVVGEIAEIDPRTIKVSGAISIHGCAGSGLALGLGTNLLEGCFLPKATRIVNFETRQVMSIDRVGGSDEVWFNSGDDRYYLGAGRNHGGPVLGVIDAKTNRWIENVTTAPHSHSVAADSEDNRVFVPLAANNLPFDNNRARGLSCTDGCIGVYGEK